MLRSVTFLDLTLLHTTTFHHSIFRLLKETVNFFVAQETFVILPKLTFRAQLLTQRIRKHDRNQTSKDVSFRSENEFNKPNSDLCFYHARFGASARSCRQPCNWRGSRRSLFRNPTDKPVGLINANLGVWMVKDPNTSVNFMVDTGSAVSLLPCSRSAGDNKLTGHMIMAL